MRPRTRRAVRAISLVVATALAVGVAATSWWARRPATLEQLDDYGVVPEFGLTEQSGRRITREDLRGLVWVADFIYTECPRAASCASAPC